MKKILVTDWELMDVLAESTESSPFKVFPHPDLYNAWIVEVDERFDTTGYDEYII